MQITKRVASVAASGLMITAAALGCGAGPAGAAPSVFFHNSPDPNGTTVYAYINGEFTGDGNWYNGPTDTRKGDTVCAEDGTGDGSYSSSLPTAAGVPGLDA
ncbi:hypothetical protein [Streptomyces sp. NPDC058142]|uniref:hypothetical protein n=1 Tax=Streptomyces sp. NPDC058142 TaxID=3346355 RepID=UPI0036E9683A